MDRVVAKWCIDALKATGMPVHPDYARQLYTDAGYDIPEHLKKREYTEEERKEMEATAQKLMNSLF